MKVLNKTKLAHEMGRGPGYISAMVRAGYRMQYGTLTTLRHALQWLAAHPDFRQTDVYRPRARKAATAADKSPAPSR
jgi:hypothetical protein